MPDAHDFVGVLRALAERCDLRIAREGTRHDVRRGAQERERGAPGAAQGGEPAGWRVRRLVPRVDGQVIVELGGESGASGGARLIWGAPPPPEPPPPGPPLLEPAAPEPTSPGERAATEAAWSWGRLSASEGVPAWVRRAVAEAIREALALPAFAMLRYVNRDQHAFWYDDGVVDRLLAGRFAVGVSRWHDIVLSRIFQDQADGFELEFEGPAGSLRYRVLAPGSQRPEEGERVLGHPLFELRVVRDPRREAERRRFETQVERMVGLVLCRGVHRAMRLGASGSAGPDTWTDLRAADDQSLFRGAAVSTSRWGSSLQWRQFFSDFEIARGNLCGIQYSDAVASIVHGEPECQMVEPTALPRAVTFSQPPWRTEPAPPPSGSRAYASVLGEREALFGGAPQLEQALEAAVTDGKVGLVLVNDTCLSKITGDDVSSALARARARSSVPVVWMDTDQGDPDEVHADLLQKWFSGVESQDLDAAPTVSLFGFPAGPARRELDDLLGDLGVSVAAHLVPVLGRDTVTRYLRGRVQGVYPWSHTLGLHQRLFSESPAPRLDLPAPYGVTDTLAWLGGIAGALGRGDAFEAWRARQDAAGWRVELARLREQAASHRLAVVVSASELDRVLVAERCYGVRLLPLLAELGFGLDLVLVPPEGAGAPLQVEAARAQVESALPSDARIWVHAATTRAELTSLLGEGAFDAVYTELTCDDRVTRAGKPPFHLGMIEMGLAGAVRTARRLVRRAAWPFFQRYGGYLHHAE